MSGLGPEKEVDVSEGGAGPAVVGVGDSPPLRPGLRPTPGNECGPEPGRGGRRVAVTLCSEGGERPGHESGRRWLL